MGGSSHFQDFYDGAQLAGETIDFYNKYSPYVKKAYNYVKANQQSFMSQVRKPLSQNNSKKMTLRSKRTINSIMQPSGARMRGSRGLTIGKRKRASLRDKVMAITNPSQKFNSKWTFQADSSSGKVGAISIPILTKPLLDPIWLQLFSNVQTDNGGLAGLDPTMVTSQTPAFTNQYRVIISNYVSTYKFYNSSSNTCRCRLVWYKPKNDSPSSLNPTNTLGVPIPNNPINLTMWASTVNDPWYVGATGNPFGGNSYVAPNSVGDGCVFQQATSAVGTSWTDNYDHAGWPVSGTIDTTLSSPNNVVAMLDPRLVPGSPQVKSVVNRYWTTLKSEEFTLEPGHQFNTSLRMKNRIHKRASDNVDMYCYKDNTVIGVLYMLGQIVFAQTSAEITPSPIASVITTGSTQISCIREDTCSMRPDVRRVTRRLNLTKPLQLLDGAEQAIINTETGKMEFTFDQDR